MIYIILKYMYDVLFTRQRLPYIICNINKYPLKLSGLAHYTAVSLKRMFEISNQNGKNNETIYITSFLF
jgi:hypothetical protein